MSFLCLHTGTGGIFLTDLKKKSLPKLVKNYVYTFFIDFMKKKKKI